MYEQAVESLSTTKGEHSSAVKMGNRFVSTRGYSTRIRADERASGVVHRPATPEPRESVAFSARETRRRARADRSLHVPDERGPERLVEYRVDDRIDRRGNVSQPQAHLGHVVGHRAVGFRADREQDVQQKERRPAQHEREEHHAQHFAGLLFGSHGVGGREALALLSVGQKSASTGNGHYKHGPCVIGRFGETHDARAVCKSTRRDD